MIIWMSFFNSWSASFYRLRWQCHHLSSHLWSLCSEGRRCLSSRLLCSCQNRIEQGDNRGAPWEAVRAPNHNKEPWLSCRPNMKTEPHPHCDSHSPNQDTSVNTQAQTNSDTHTHTKWSLSRSVSKQETNAADHGLSVWLWPAKQTSSLLVHTEAAEVRWDRIVTELFPSASLNFFRQLIAQGGWENRSETSRLILAEQEVTNLLL